jgi:hypothetical protein
MNTLIGLKPASVIHDVAGCGHDIMVDKPVTGPGCLLSAKTDIGQPLTSHVTLNLRGHLIEPDHARKPAYLTLLVAAKPHQKWHRRPDQFPHHRAIDIDVQLGARAMLGAAQLRAHDFAKRGFDCRPIFNLIRCEA